MDNLKTHRKKCHGETDVSKPGRFQCHKCNMSFYHAKKLVTHYTDEHKHQIGRLLFICLSGYVFVGKHLAIQQKEFPNLMMFRKWKKEEESMTYTSFVPPKGEAVDGGGRFILYRHVHYISNNYICREKLPHTPVCLLSRWPTEGESAAKENIGYQKGRRIKEIEWGLLYLSNDGGGKC